jgi:flagellar motor protein MotB
MSIDRNTAIQQLGNNSSTSNQQSLVKKLAGPKVNKQLVHVIPGGANLTELVSKENLPQAIFTWLRRCRHFKDVMITFADNLNDLKTTSSLVVDFNTNTRLPEWEVQGKKWLSDRISEVLSMQHVVAVKVVREGIQVFLDEDQSFSSESSNWMPKIIFTPNKIGEYK